MIDINHNEEFDRRARRVWPTLIVVLAATALLVVAAVAVVRG